MMRGLSGKKALFLIHCVKLMSPAFLTVATFRNAQVSHTNGGIAVVCHDSCHFSDGSDSKAWTCGQDLPEEHEGCVCPGTSIGITFPCF